MSGLEAARNAASGAALGAAAARYVADGSVPGVAVAVTDRDALLASSMAGWRELESRRPVDADTLFEIGSIGKPFAALVVLQLEAEGRLGLDDPVVRHLPWFRVPRHGRRITIRHLLTHTAGIGAGVDGTPEAVAQVWRLRSVPPGSAPGRRFHYSNVGYKAVGLVVEAVEGRPFADVVRDRIIRPLGMTMTEPAITNGIRGRLAVGYAPARDDQPWSADAVQAPAPWLETSTADGSIASTAPDMTRFVRHLMADPDGHVARMLEPVRARGADGSGMGLSTHEVDGHVYRGKDGAMVGFVAAMLWDDAVGIGAVVLQNGFGHDPDALARTAIRQAAAARAGEDPASVPLEGIGPDDRDLETDSGHDLEADDDDDRLPPPSEPTAAQAVVVGTYRSHDPWFPVFWVEARGGGLWLRQVAGADGFDDHAPLVPMARGWYRVGAERGAPERLRFDLVIDGRARRAWLSGWDYYRVDEGGGPE